MMDHSEGADASLQAQAHIWNHMLSFINSMSLKCAVQLGIPDAIHKHGGQPVSLSRLALALEIPPSRAVDLGRLMRLLTHSGFFTTQIDADGGGGEEAYLLNKYSELLLSNDPGSISPMLCATLDPLALASWHSLSAWFHTAASPTPHHHLHGVSAWEMTDQDTPEMDCMFNQAMASDSHLTMNIIIKENPEVFQGVKSLVDVGGGTGATAVALTEAFPMLKCTVLDLPRVVASAVVKSTKVEFMAGDMFEYIPPADAILLKWILHDWSDEHCVKLLKLCKEAISCKEGRGKVIIVDMVVSKEIHHHKLKETQYFFDMLMMVYYGGKERSEEEWQKLFTDAGFSDYKVSARFGLRSIIELYP